MDGIAQGNADKKIVCDYEWYWQCDARKKPVRTHLRANHNSNSIEKSFHIYGQWYAFLPIKMPTHRHPKRTHFFLAMLPFLARRVREGNANDCHLKMPTIHHLIYQFHLNVISKLYRRLLPHIGSGIHVRLIKRQAVKKEISVCG